MIIGGRTVGAAAILVVVAASVLGCGAKYRRVETHLGANAHIFVDGRELRRDEAGAIEIALGPERSVVRLEEPRKPAVVADVHVLVNPRGDLEDQVVMRSTANTLIVYVGDERSIAGPTGPVALFADPLSLLRDAEGPFFGPARGQGVILVATERAAKGSAGGIAVEFKAAGERPESPTLPVAVELAPGWQPVRVEAPGAKPYEALVFVRPGEYVLLAVRLAPEGAAQ